MSEKRCLICGHRSHTTKECTAPGGAKAPKRKAIYITRRDEIEEKKGKRKGKQNDGKANDGTAKDEKAGEGSEDEGEFDDEAEVGMTVQLVIVIEGS